VANDGLGAAILAYGAGDEFRALIASLLDEGLAAEQIVLVHNSAAAGEAPPAAPAGVEVVATGANPGYAGGMNAGVARLRERGCEQLLLLTHDARLRPGALAALRAAADAHPGYGVLAPVLLVTGTEELFSCGGVTSRDGATSHRRHLPGGAAAGEVVDADWVDGGTMLVRREVFERVGQFDARFWGYVEEADLCLRARRAGIGVGVVTAARADQDSGQGKRIGAWAYLITRNGIEYAGSAAGARGVAALTGRALAIVALNLLRYALRRAGVRGGDPAEPWALAVGTARGALDRFRGRWGAPPPGLPGIGDVGNA
jgi:N-acetylglucosaminyl-diphospho-decaprenol L-rhamnosyltransferase